MGLLDVFNSEPGRMGLGLLGGGFGQQLRQGVASMDDFRKQQMIAEIQKLQMQKAQAEMADAQEQRKAQAAQLIEQQRLQSLFRNAGTVPANMQGTEAANAMLPAELRIGAQAQLQQPGKVDYNALRQQGMPAAMLEQLAKIQDLGMPEVARTVKGMQNGREVEQQYDKFGRPVGQGMEQFKAPISVRRGDSEDLIDPYTMKPRASFGINQSPDSKASNALGWANHNLSRETKELARNAEGKAPAGYAWGPVGADGQPTMIAVKGGPADVKAGMLAQQKALGAADVDSAVASLRDAYDRLETGGGITSTKNGSLSNMAASSSSSGLGQAVGRAFGTQNQSARNDIAMTRPALLAALMKATGMSAKQMDSNAELKLWMTTATDPTLDVESNRRALNAIERKYLGASAGTVETQPTAKAPMKGQTVDGYKFKGGNPADPNSWERQ